jgi:hypothetical protein
MYCVLCQTERMKIMKSLRTIAILLAALFVFSGCNMIKVNPERDGAQVVAVVNGEEITKLEVFDTCNANFQTDYKISQKVESWESEAFKSNLEQTLEGMIAQKIILLYAKDHDMYTFSEAEQKEIDENIASYYQDTYDTALTKYQDEAKTDPSVKPEEKAMADVDAELASEGTSREKIRKIVEDDEAYQKLYKSITDAVSPTDTDVLKAYQDELTNQQTAYDADASTIISDENSGATILYFPNDSFVRVRQILIPLSQDVITQINNLRQKNTDADTIAADTLRATELAKIRGKADEAVATAIAANGDLTKLDQAIEAYKASGYYDPGMDTFTNGYLINKESKNYVQAFTDSAMTLSTIGHPTLAATDYGYHILWLTKKIAKGAVPYDQVKDKVAEAVKASQQKSTWYTTMQGWIDTDYKSKISRYTGRLTN